MEPGIEGRAVGVDGLGTGSGGCGNLGAGREAGIEQPLGVETGRCRLVECEPLRLTHDGLFPGEAEPGEIVEDLRDEFLAAALAVDVLDAQEEAAAETAGHVGADESGQRMAEMELSVRARRKAEDGTIPHARPATAASEERLAHVNRIRRSARLRAYRFWRSPRRRDRRSPARRRDRAGPSC